MFPLGRLKVFYISPSLFALTWSNVKAPTESQSQSEFDNGCLIVLEKKADIFLIFMALRAIIQAVSL